jgi:hypothetical protein
VKTLLSIFLLFVVGAGTAQAASFDCVAPVFPEYSTSKEGVRRIERQVREWRACNAAHRAGGESVQVDRLNSEVDANLAKWITATRAYSNGNSHNMLTEMEREKVDYGTWMRGSSQGAGSSKSGKL